MVERCRENGCWGLYSRPFSFCEMLFCFFNSLLTSITDSMNAEKSATGPAYNTPRIPKRSGRIRIRGIRKKTCLVSASKAPFVAFSVSKERNDVLRETLQQEEADCGNNQIPFYCKQVCFPNAGILPGPVVKADDGLNSL